MIPDPFNRSNLDPYSVWLGIPAHKRPPTYFDLLHLSPKVNDRETIKLAAKRQKSVVDSFRGSEHEEWAARISYEINEATVCLLDPTLRRSYRNRLRNAARKGKLYSANVKESIPAYIYRQIVGEESGITREFAGVMLVLTTAILVTLVVSFLLPWGSLPEIARERRGVHVDDVAAQPPKDVGEKAPNPMVPAKASDNAPVEKIAETEQVGEVRVFQGHQQAINSVAFSPDGMLIASGSDDKTVRVWDVKTGMSIWTASPFGTRVLKVLFSPDGKKLLACDRKELYEFESRKGKVLETFEIGMSDYVDISRDGRLLLKAHKQGALVVFDLDQKNQILNQERNWGTAIATFDPSGEHIIYGEYGLDRQNLKSKNIQKRLIKQLGYFEGLDVSPDGRILATGSGKLWEDNQNKLGNCLVRLWNLYDGSEVKQFSEHSDWVRAVAFSPSGQHLLSGGGGTPNDWHGHRAGADRKLRLWNVNPPKLNKEFDGHRAGILSVCFSPDGQYALSGSADKTLRLWKLPDELPMAIARKSNTPQSKAALQEKKNTTPPVTTVTYTFENRDSLRPFRCSGRYNIKGGGGLEFRKPENANLPHSKAVSASEFTYPITANFQVYALSDATYDVWPGLFESLTFYWGNYYNTVTNIKVGPDMRTVRNRKIMAGKPYQIELSVDENRLFKISIDGELIHQEVVNNNVKLQGPIVLGGGIGHVVYKKVTVTGREL
ncbi:WD domain, G-beta repeat [Polystyrenella longa]|uniref:WD domain, G-beta repeat n=1 Tax=Polystyrenella longa TaxID=2528007 RepID=A0A518CMM1_9PLAN|nr:WD40 repeat domain-containing protein [Polystyrenella longa]QDU80468.1 WD domain, G-beta repeat [Polystyrenella longa]